MWGIKMKEEIMNKLLETLAIVIGEDPRICDIILKKLEEKNEIFRIDFEILINDLCNEGKIKIDI